MAMILEHPDKDYDPSKQVLHLGDKVVILKDNEGEPLSLLSCLGMLEAAKALILEAWLEENAEQ